MRMICALLLPLVLVGCGSVPAGAGKATPIPSERLLAYQKPVEGSGEIVVNRDVGMLGGGCYVAVLVDRQVAARIGIGESASFHVPPGTRVLGIGLDEQDDTLCSKGRLRRELAVPVANGERLYFRIVSEAKSGFDIRPVTP